MISMAGDGAMSKEGSNGGVLWLMGRSARGNSTNGSTVLGPTGGGIFGGGMSSCGSSQVW